MTTPLITRHSNLGPVTRAALAALAFGGSALYALSFTAAANARPWAVHAFAVGVAAGLSWMAFGVLLVVVTRGRPSITSWIDACLVTMAVGITITLFAVGLNLAAWWNDALAPCAAHLVSIHLTILACADVTMAARFCAESRARTLSLRTALALWVALNSLFGVLLFIFWFLGGLS